MNNNKHIHDEDYDFSIKLMVPLLSILVCTICLCATTWAWYTASVSTGVNTITSGVNVQVTATINGELTDSQSGTYTLNPTQTLQLSFSGSGAANGYYALIDITDEAGEEEPSSLLETMFGLFVNEVYALENDNSEKLAIYFNEGDNSGSLTVLNLNETKNKIVTVRFVWADPIIQDGEIKGHQLNGIYSTDYVPTDNSTLSITINDEVTTTTLIAHFLNAETHEYLPSELSETSTFGLNQEQAGLVEVYEFEGTSYEVYAPEGYLVVTSNENGEEIYAQSVVFENLDEGKTTEVLINCVPIEEETQDDEVITSNDEINNSDTEQGTSDSTYEEDLIGDTNIGNESTSNPENSSDEIETSGIENSDLINQNNGLEVTNTDETEQTDSDTEQSGDKPIESLLITDSNDEEKESIPSSYDINSGTE